MAHPRDEIVFIVDDIVGSAKRWTELLSCAADPPLDAAGAAYGGRLLQRVSVRCVHVTCCVVPLQSVIAALLEEVCNEDLARVPAWGIGRHTKRC